MDIIDEVFYGNPVKVWLVALAVVVFVFLAIEVLLLMVARRSKLTDGMEGTFTDDFLPDVFKFRTNVLLILIFSIYAGSLVLNLPEKIANLARSIAVIAFAFQMGLWGSKAIMHWITRRKALMIEKDPGSTSAYAAISFMLKVALWSLISLLILSNLGVNITALVAGLGVGGIAIALSLQNILGDLFASMTIVFDKPFVIGDSIAVGDYSGKVEHIGIKTTRIRSLSGEQIIIPNGVLLNSKIRNKTSMLERRASFSIRVTYQTPLDKLKNIPPMIGEIIKNFDKTRFDRAHFKEYGESALIFEIVYFVLVPDYGVYRDIQQNINLEIFERFQREGIDFAYPTRTVYQINATAD